MTATSPATSPNSAGECHTPRTFRGDLGLALSHDGRVPQPPSGLLSARERPPPEEVYYPKPPLSYRGPPKRGVDELQHTPRTFRGDSPLATAPTVRAHARTARVGV